MLFDQDFEIFIADTDAGIALNQQIRYEVFCLEKGFENPQEFPDRREQDHFDDVSVHFVVREKATGHWVGATRIILPLAERFPVEQHDCLVREHADGLARYRLSEVSRICTVRADAAAWTGRFGAVPAVIGGISLQQERDVLFGLIRAIIEYCLAHGIESGYMLVTSAFARLLKRVGVAYHQVGIETEFRGKRAPYFIDYGQTKRTMCSQSEAFASLFARQDLAYRPTSSIERRPHPQEVTIPEFSLGMPLGITFAS